MAKEVIARIALALFVIGIMKPMAENGNFPQAKLPNPTDAKQKEKLANH